MLRGRSSRSGVLGNLLSEGHDLSTTVINVAETYAGTRNEELARVNVLFNSMHCYEINREVAVHAGELKRDWQRKGIILHLPDLLIAAIALRYGLALFTDNVKDFPMKELILFDGPRTIQ